MKTFQIYSIFIFLTSCSNIGNDANVSIQSDTTKPLTSTETTITTVFYPIFRDTTYDQPFDTILDNYMNNIGNSGGSTNDMINMFYRATIKLDSLLELKYTQLIKKLDKVDQVKLKTSQDNWKKFRESEADFLMSAYYTWANESKYGHGREHSITQAEWRYTTVRRRLVSLTNYNEEIYDEDN